MNDNISLFDINGSYGCGAYARPECATPEALVQHMDYLGVQRSLVWHLGARDVNPTWGNRRLLDEIGADDVLAGRLIPALVLTPAAFFEDGGMECLRGALESGRTRAFRVFPGTSGFRLREVERVVSKISRYKPVVFWDFRNRSGEQDVGDVVDLADTYPDVTFVCTEMMWPQFGAMLDVMWRCGNVSVDISWLHMRRAIELVVEEFGAERVFFGTGLRAHYGAAIGALAHAQISEKDRRKIACGNAERHLGLDSTEESPAVPGLLDEKPLWKWHREGLPLENVRIIDAHGHTAPHTRGWYLPDTDIETGLKELIEQMDRLGVERTIVSAEPALFGHALEGNRELEPLLAQYADRIGGYLAYNPYYGEEMKTEMEDFFHRGAYVGFKILPDYWEVPVTDEGYEPVWECANRRRLPVLIHTWEGSYDAPAALTDVVQRYPDAMFLLGHSGGGNEGRRQAEELALHAPNVYLEFCGSFLSSIPFQGTMSRVGNDRVVFGSDTGAHSQVWELSRYLSAPVPDEYLVPGLAANMERILNKGETGSD